MLTRLALIAPPGKSQQSLRARLSRPLIYNVHEFHSLAELQQRLLHFPFNVLVIRLRSFALAQAAMVQRIQNAFPGVGLITVSPDIRPDARYAVRSLVRHALVDEELELDDLDQLISKVQKTRERAEPTARMHPRTRRHDELVIITRDDVSETETFLDARFLDFATMGAKVVLNSNDDSNLAVKTRIEVRYQSSEDRKRVHRLEARVVWIKKTGAIDSLFGGPKTTLGLRFVAAL